MVLLKCKCNRNITSELFLSNFILLLTIMLTVEAFQEKFIVRSTLKQRKISMKLQNKIPDEVFIIKKLLLLSFLLIQNMFSMINTFCYPICAARKLLSHVMLTLVYFFFFLSMYTTIKYKFS